MSRTRNLGRIISGESTTFDLPMVFNISSHITLPKGTTAQRPGAPVSGMIRHNTTIGSLEFYDGTNWLSTNLVPTINSITGSIYGGAASTLTLSVTNSTDTINVEYYEGSTLLATEASVSVTSGSATSTVPAAVYGQTAGDTITIRITNSDNTPSSNTVNKTVVALPSGGTITTSGSYRIHTFTSSGTFTNTLSNLSVTRLIVAGGAGASGFGGGGGGAGGLLYQTSTIATGDFPIVVGAGGAGSSNTGNNGSNSSAFGSTAIGGGTSGNDGNLNGASGGSGGGAGTNASQNGVGGSGTSGQGNKGGDQGGQIVASGGGGGAGAAGGNASGSTAGNGGAGLQYDISGTASYYAAGGGGGARYGATGNGTPGSGGSGIGGNGAANNTGTPGTAGATNTGAGGGGGSGYNNQSAGGSGGSGIVIIRYEL